MVTEQQQWELISPQPTATETERQTLLQSLQRMTHDETLELRDVEAIESQTRWSFCGTPAGYRRIYTLFQSQQLPRLLELPVQQIVKVRKGTAPRSTVPPEQVLYRYVSDYAQTHPPEAVIKHLHHVVVEAHIEQLGELQVAIAALVLDKDAAEQFPTVLLKTFYQIIDVWQLDTQTRHQIPQLLTVFEHLPAIGFRQARTIRRLRELINVFLESPAFQSLQRVCQLYHKPLAQPEQPLEGLVARYASLYPYLVLPSESEYELGRTIRYCQERRQQHYSLRLSRFVMYYARLAEVAKARQLSHGAGRVIRRESNPTLLSDRELASALRHFWRSTQGKPSQALRAERLRSDIHHLGSYAQFKDKLYAYLTKADCPPQQEAFQILLQQQLQEILPSYATRKPSDSLSLRTATKLLNFLVVENAKQRDHYFLIETVANLGATFTVGLLWKLILLCPPLETELNKRLALLFDHYAQFPQQEVHWLIQLLETYQLASSVHLGQVDLSPLTAMIRSKKPKQK